MPANLTPEYLEAERNYRAAKTPEEKLQLLEYMLSVIPKHKGTEKLQSDLKKKIAKFSAEGAKKGAASRRGSMFNISREGAGQVALTGAPNAGKSSILDLLTNARPEVADYPFTTIKPQPGMLEYDNIKIQLVDLPPVSPDWFENWVAGIIRNADLALLVVNLASDTVLEENEFVIQRLSEAKLHLVEKVNQRFHPDGSAEIKTRMVFTHADHPDAPEVLDLFREALGDQFPSLMVSLADPAGTRPLADFIFESLEIVRVYTKSPGKPPDFADPVTLPRGATVMDFAINIHKDLARNLKFARIWGNNKYDGQKVPRDYLLMDQDVVELRD